MKPASVNQYRKITLKQLRCEEAELLHQLCEVRKALEILSDEPPAPKSPFPPTRRELLEEYLLNHPEGTPVKDLPLLLRTLGFVSRATNDTSNWIYQCGGDFVVEHGILKLSPKVSTDGNGNGRPTDNPPHMEAKST
jgi:hypothetical protein